MLDSNITALLDQNWQNPDTGDYPALPVKEIHIAPGLIEKASDLLDALAIGQKPAIVADENTMEAAGKHIAEQIDTENIILLEGDLHPSQPYVEHIMEQSANADYLIAVGSGTINDLTKLAAFERNMPYVIFPTAPSMNGYLSANASVIYQGFRTSVPAQLPVAVFCDTTILANAPRRMIIAGIGDSLCRSTAQADWLLSHYLMGTPYKEAPFELTKMSEKEVLKRAPKAIAGDEEAIELLMNCLLLSGLGMTLAGGSHPASQGEHMIAHYIEMMASDLPQTLHGEQICVTTLSMALIQESLMQSCPKLRPTPDDREIIAMEFGDIAPDCYEQWQKKILTPGKTTELNQKLASEWEAISDHIERIRLPYKLLQTTLAECGAPTTPDQLEWPEGLYQRALRNAMYTRDRFTFLDLAYHAAP